MLDEKLTGLVKAAKMQHTSGSLEFEELERVTSSIIAEDEFDSLPESIQDAIYFIDMHEIEAPSSSQIMQSIKKIEDFLLENRGSGD